MAGIGFELKKLFERKGVFSILRAYGYAGVVCVGPMVMGMLLLLGVYVLAEWAGIPREMRDEMTCMLTYTFLLSLVITNTFSMGVTRYVADCLYEEKNEKVMPALYGSLSLMLTAGGVGYGIFLIVFQVEFFYTILLLLLLAELIVVWTQMNFLTAIKDYKGMLRAFAMALAVGLGSGWLLIQVGNYPAVPVLMGSICLAYGILCVRYHVLLRRFFPKAEGRWRAFLGGLWEHPCLTGCGICVSIGLFAHIVIMWTSGIGVQISGPFWAAPGYDVPAVIAFLSTLITAVNFITSVEVNFYPKYRTYYSLFNDRGTLTDIEQAEREMRDVLQDELSYNAAKQVFGTIVFIVAGTVILPALPLGFTEEMLGIYRVLCLGYAFYSIGNSVMLLSLYFSDERGALLSNLVFAAVSVTATAAVTYLPEKYYGFGFVIGAFCFMTVAILRLWYYQRRISYYVLSKQPIALKRKKGRLVKVLISCLCLGILAGCGEEKAEIIMKQETDSGAYGENGIFTTTDNLPITDNDAWYEGWDSNEVVTMYLTVKEGNADDGTNHTWKEVSTYSAYYYEDLGVERYKVEGLLQVGDENGPVVGELGYGQHTPNATVQVRGQTSSRQEQKNYRIKLKDSKGDWEGMTTINLNKHVSDGKRYTNMLCYNLMQDIDEMFSARTRFVHLYVKDETASGDTGVFEDYGLYTFVEQINKKYLTNHGLDKNGQLYKVNFFEFYTYEDVIMLKSDKDYDVKEFEKYLEIKGSDDHGKLMEMLQDLNDYTVPIEETFTKWFDEENYFTYLAFHILVGNKDTQSRNQFLYSPRNINKFYFISWDNDAALHALESEWKGRQEGLAYEEGVSNYWANILHRRILSSENYRKKLDEKILELKETVLTEEKITEMAKKYAATVRPYLYRLPDITHAPISMEQFDMAAENIYDMIEENYDRYLLSLEKSMPFYLGTPTVKDNKLHFLWEQSYDFDRETVTYDFELSRGYAFTEVIEKKEGLIVPTTETELLEPGQYFYRVTATNASGYEQTALDYYVSSRGKEYGVFCFWVMPDGQIQMEIYEE